MTQLNRREWLRLLGVASAATAAGLPTLAANDRALGSAVEATGAELVRLSANENPYGPSPAVREAMIKAFDQSCRYPFAQAGELATLLAKKEGVKPENIVLTAGSTEGLKAAGLTFGLAGGEIVAADPTFQALMDYAEQFGAYIHRVPLTPELGHDLVAMERRVSNKTGLVFVCNPNNPTGHLLGATELRDFCQRLAARTMVFCDEAYCDYITAPNYPSMVELVRQDYNVIVSRTFSKVHGLAGVRIGYLIARADLATRLRENTMANLSMLAIHAAKAALNDTAFYQFSLQKAAEAKKQVYNLLDELKLSYVPSHGNFVFFKTGQDIRELQTAMAQQGVLVGRPFPPLLEWCRISLGTPSEMNAFTGALRQVLRG